MRGVKDEETGNAKHGALLKVEDKYFFLFEQNKIKSETPFFF